MPSARYSVMATIQSALEGSTGIVQAKVDLDGQFDWNVAKLPGCTIIEGMTELSRLSYESTAADDMEAKIELTIRGYVHDPNNDKATKRTNLIAAIEKVMMTSTGIAAVTKYVNPMSVQPDEGLMDNFSVFDSKFLVVYHYNHKSP